MDEKQLHLHDLFPPVTRADWDAAVEKVLKGRKSDTLRRRTYEGFEVEPLYAGQAIPSYLAAPPEQAPYARGHHTMARRQAGWDIRQEYDCGALSQVASLVAADCQRGVTSLGFVPGYTRQRHQDTAAGLPLFRTKDWLQVLADVDLSTTPLAVEAGAYLLPTLAVLAEVAEQKGVALSSWSGAVYADPLATLAREGVLDDQWDRIWDDTADAIVWAEERAPDLKLLCCSGLPYHDAGSHAAQELAFVLASAVESLRALEARGVAPERAARVAFVRVGVGRHLFVSIAKIRALRLLWSQVMQACGVSDEGQQVFVHAVTSRVTMAQRDPWTNLLRNTSESFSAAVAGADAITIQPFDRVLGEPSPLARRLASNTQLLLQQEAHVGRVVDPAGGSWYMEHLTEQLAREAWRLLQAVEEKGGMQEALASGWVHETIAATVDEKQRQVARRREPVVGVSAFANLDEAPVLRPPPEVATKVAPTNAPAALLQALSTASAPKERMTALQQAATQGHSVYDLWDALHPQAQPLTGPALPSFRWAAAWEALRDASDAFLEKEGRRPSVFLANLGPIPAHKDRAGFAGRLLAAGGFATLTNTGFSDPETLAAAFAESQADGVVLCGSDDDYQEWGVAAAAALQPHAPGFVALAGRPGERETGWRRAGVEFFLYLGCDALALLQTLQKKLGVRA